MEILNVLGNEFLKLLDCCCGDDCQDPDTSFTSYRTFPNDFRAGYTIPDDALPVTPYFRPYFTPHDSTGRNSILSTGYPRHKSEGSLTGRGSLGASGLRQRSLGAGGSLDGRGASLGGKGSIGASRSGKSLHESLRSEIFNGRPYRHLYL